MKIVSPAFAHGAHIPEPYTRFGENQSPPLVFSDVPPQARSLALILDDPDAPRGTFTHWIVFDLAPTIEGLKENTRPTDGLQELGHGGPRPPNGEHRYFFKLFALDRTLDVPSGAGRAQVDAALRGHIVAEAELMGRFATPVQAERDAR